MPGARPRARAGAQRARRAARRPKTSSKAAVRGRSWNWTEIEASLRARAAQSARSVPSWLRSAERNDVRNVTHAFVFSNSNLGEMWSFPELHSAVRAPLASTALVFCNHGGPAARWYAERLFEEAAAPPALVEWFLHYNGVKRWINACEGWTEELRTRTLRARFFLAAPLITHLLDNGQWQEWKFTGRAAGKAARYLRKAAKSCLALGPGSPEIPYIEASYERHLRHELKLPIDYSSSGLKELSTGAVAALATRLAYPSHVRVVAVGFSGRCSFLSPNSSSESTTCAKYHDFSRERSLLAAAGVTFATPAPSHSQGQGALAWV